jgi:NAD+ diphosphatase
VTPARPGGPLALSRATVDRAADRRADRDWMGRAWADRGRVLWLDADLQVVYRPGPQLELRPATGPLPADALFLGAEDDAAYFALDAPAGAAAPVDAPADRPRGGLRDLGAALTDRDAGLLVHAVALATWHRGHPRCPRCGERTVIVHAGASRRCPADGSEHFPRSDPAMIVLVRDGAGGRVVLGRQPGWPRRMWSCLAGFVEPGESVERAVVREVAEEVGLRVADVRYVSSQPWPFPSSLMLGFTAVAGGEAIVRADAELEDARWFGRTELAAAVRDGVVRLPPPVSIARRLIDGWLDET